MMLTYIIAYANCSVSTKWRDITSKMTTNVLQLTWEPKSDMDKDHALFIKVESTANRISSLACPKQNIQTTIYLKKKKASTHVCFRNL